MERSGILAEFFADGPALLLTALVFLATAVLTFSIMLGLRARRHQAPRRRHLRIFRRHGGCSLAQRFEPQSRPAPSRLRHQALWGEREGQGRDEGVAAPHDPG